MQGGACGAEAYIEIGYEENELLDAAPQVGVLSEALDDVEGFEDVNDVVDTSALDVEVLRALLQVDLGIVKSAT